MDITYEAFRTDAAIVTTNSSFITIYEAMKQVADSAYVLEDTANTIEYYNNVWFDIIYSPKTGNTAATFELKTWVGVRGDDLRATQFIGPEYDNLADAVYIDDWSNRADIAFVAGDGDHALQAVGQATLPIGFNSYYYALPFGPVEITTTYDTTSAVTGDELDAEGIKALGNSINTKTIDGSIVNTGDFDFITAFDYGDIMTLSWDDIHETIEVSSFTISVSGEVEEINIPLNIIEKL